MGVTAQMLEVINYGVSILKPKPILTGSMWADNYFYLSAESSSTPGKWKTRPWQKEIIDAMTDQITPTVVFQKPTRVGYTKMLDIVIGYYIHQRPSVQLHYQPNADEAKGFAEDELEPMIRDNFEIRNLVETPNIRGRTKREKTIKKLYPGGYAEILGAESDRNFNRRTARVVSGDEIDTWKKEAGNAGDTITTMLRRTSDFWDRKNILGGKPVGAMFDKLADESLEDGMSLVNYWFNLGTQEHRYLPCPKCNHLQLFTFDDLVWEKDKDETGKTIKHYPKTAHFTCKKCQHKIYDKDKRQMDKRGKWIAHNPDSSIRSFHIWAMLSYSPNVTWGDIVKEFLEAKNNKLKLKAFYSEVLARTWEEEYEKIDIDDFSSKLEVYEANIPDGVLLLTAGVDMQDDRLECEVVGWGRAEESWSIEYKIFHGDTSKPDVWKILDEFLLKLYTCENDSKMRVFCVGVDTGGHNTQRAYMFCKGKQTRRIFAFKGNNQLNTPIVPRVASKNNKQKVPLYNVGVNSAKDILYSYIQTKEIGPGYMHFPNDPIYNEEYFKQLTAEARDKTGRWKPRRKRNEALDCRVYAYSALHVSGVDLELLALRGADYFVLSEPKKRRIIRRGL